MRANGIFPVLLAALGLGACNDVYRQWDDDISYAAAEALLASGTRRVDLALVPAPGFMLAQSFEIELDHELFDDELIAGPLRSTIARDPSGACRGSFALASPGVEVRFDEAVTFFDGDEACEDFVARVEGLLAAGATPRIVAMRQPAAIPQDPEDPVFFATLLAIDAEDVDPGAVVELELNVEPDNRLECDLLADRPSDCAGAVRVLDQVVGVSFEETEVETEDPLDLIYVDVEGTVLAVEPNERAVVLNDGVRVRFVDATAVEGGTLDEMEDRIALGDEVTIEARTVVQPTTPIALVAIEVSFSAQPAESPQLERPSIVVTGTVLDVEPDLGLVTLGLATDVLVRKGTVVEGDFERLTELDRAIGSGEIVTVEAVGPVAAREPRLVVAADTLRLFARSPQR